MPLSLIRIDDRLVHGQIVEGWLTEIPLNVIVVVSDSVADNRMQKALLGLALPAGIDFSAIHVSEAPAVLNDFIASDRKVMVLFSNPADIVRAVGAGLRIASVNLGGMHFSQGKRQILRNLSVDAADVAALSELAARGIDIEGRVLPRDEKIDIMAVLRAHSAGLPGA